MKLTKESRPILAKTENLRADPSQRMLFTIGNINGNVQLLLKMIAEIEECGMFCTNDKVIILGNFIGATGDTQEVIDVLKEYQSQRKGQVVVIRGAREQKMLCAKKNFFQSELGKGVLKSYRKPGSQYRPKECNYIDCRQITADSLWLETLPMYFQSDKYFFVHSGVNPDRDLDKQNLGGFMFIQDNFYKSPRVYDYAVVHTHPGFKSEFKTARVSIGQGDKKSLTCFMINDRWDQKELQAFKKHVAHTLVVKEETPQACGLDKP